MVNEAIQTILKFRQGEKSIQQGIEQTICYMNTFGCTEGWLAIFDQRPNIDWDKKIFTNFHLSFL